MHELSVAESICRSVFKRVGSARINEMVIEVGVLAGVNSDALRFCLGEAARLYGIDLVGFAVEEVPAEIVCDCGRVYRTVDLMEPCPCCGGLSRSFIGGADVVVTRLVLSKEDEHANCAQEDCHREE